MSVSLFQTVDSALPSARDILELMKLKIGGMIALTAVVAYIVVSPTVEPLHLLALTLLMILGSASSGIVNHVYDRDIDQRMSRTANRPLVRQPGTDLRVPLVLAALFLGISVLLSLHLFNAPTAFYLFMGALVYGVVYTIWLKRRTWTNIIFGGTSGSFAVLAGAAAADPQATTLPWLFALFLFFWTPTHFWSLAIFLKEDYRQAGIPMLPVLIGEKKAARVILINSVLLIASSLLPWWFSELGPLYGMGASALGIFLLWQNLRMVKNPDATTARANFLASMKYLGGIFCFMVADIHLPWN
ncbi:MAG: protoheme IX farnesyltransferase [Magnetococcales bacterium]|nr:protoheme IX farnesyltransferase [Magnetococcales bacterium]